MGQVKAPEKLYYAPYGDIRENYPITDNDIEYVRKDAFIEKACKFLKDKGNAYITIIDGQLILRKGIVKDFKKYMKGE